MIFCFQTVERIYFVMPFIRGGELFQHLRTARFFPEEKVRFYAASIGLALDYLHSKGIIYRNIKPENILIGEDGYLRLIDFRMAKIIKNDEKATSFCGLSFWNWHNRAADWWCFGILIFEMLCGIQPFYCDNNEKMYELIMHAELKFPKKIPISANNKDYSNKDLLKKLLVKK